MRWEWREGDIQRPHELLAHGRTWIFLTSSRSGVQGQEVRCYRFLNMNVWYVVVKVERVSGWWRESCKVQWDLGCRGG